MRFREAVEATPELAEGCCAGIQALAEPDRNRIDCADTRRLSGSVNLEHSLRSRLPEAPLWDYGIGWGLNRGSDCAIWVEVHPANSSHVKGMVAKAAWLKGWLGGNAPDLLGMTRAEDGYVWISSGAVALTRNSRQARQLAQAGVSFPRERLKLG